MNACINWNAHLAQREATETRRTLRTVISAREDYEPPIPQLDFLPGSRCGNIRSLRTQGCVQIVDLIGDNLPEGEWE